MEFIKTHLFVVILAGATLLLAVGVYLVPPSGQVDQVLQTRTDLMARLVRWKNSGQKYNTRVVDARREQIEADRGDAARVINGAIQFNRRDLHVLDLPLWRGSQREGNAPAFPIDPKLYQEYGLKYYFTETYIAAMKQLRERLHPTALPTAEELLKSAEFWEAYLRKLAGQEAGPVGPGEMPPPGPRPMPSPVAPMPMPTPGWTNPARPPSLTEPPGHGTVQIDIPGRAKLYAIEKMRHDKAQEGWMYASLSNMDLQWSDAVGGATDAALWTAQVKYWVTTEIVLAIERTVQQKAAEGHIQKLTVENSPIKHLVRVDVDESFVGTAPTTTGAGSTGGGPGLFTPPPPQDGGIYIPEGMEGMEGMGRPTPSPYGPTGMGIQGAPKGVSITGRTTCDTYDVVRYSFTVVMPTTEMYRLQKNLETHNWNTVVNWSMKSPASAARGTLPSPSADGQEATGLYYYGSDSVMEVTFDCELLLLSAWVRGTPDPTNPQGEGGKINWKPGLAPLMPVEVLRTIPDSARRAIDQTRISASSRQ